MWLYFNSNGQLIKSLEHGSPARAGTTNFSIFAVFNGIDESDIQTNCAATIKLKKPDLTGTEYPILLMDNASSKFGLVGSETPESVYPFEVGKTYYGFLFDFANFNTDQDSEILLDTPGLWEAIITLITGVNMYNVQGIATFNVGGTGTETPTEITYEIIINQIIAYMREIMGFNLENGTGINSIEQKMADETVNFTGRNPNAEAIDSSLSTTLNTGASGNQSFATNKNTMALATASFTNGNKTVAKGEESHAEGYQSVTLGDGSHAEGEQTTSAGSVSHSEGSNTVSGGVASHAEGVRSKTSSYDGIQDSGTGAHAEGENTNASGYCSHTEGFGSYTGPIDNIPSYPDIPDEPGGGGGGEPVPQVGNVAHAEGNYCFATGTGSHAEGYHTKALHEASHAEGVGTKTSNAGQHVSGYYNADDSDALFIIGNGTADNARSNAFKVSNGGVVTASTFVGNLSGNAASANTANSASTSDTAQTANLVHINVDSSYVGAILVNSDSNANTVVRKDNITVTSDGRLTVGADPTNDLDVATKKYVDGKATKLYRHNLTVFGRVGTLTVISTRPMDFTDLSSMVDNLDINDAIQIKYSNATLSIYNAPLLSINFGIFEYLYDNAGTLAIGTDTFTIVIDNKTAL